MSIDRPLHVLILAGGSGTRFWPWSRTDLPKQFLALDGSATLLEQTLRRLDGWVPPEQRWILTRADLVEKLFLSGAGVHKRDALRMRWAEAAPPSI